MKSKSNILEDVVEWAYNHKRWPTVSSTPIPETTARRRFGTWWTFLTEVRDSYIETHGIAEWDVPTSKQGPQRQALLNEIASVVESSLSNIAAMPPIKPMARKIGKAKEDAEVILPISDVHIGENNEASLCSNITEYSYEIFEQAADRYEERVRFFSDLYRKAFNLTRLRVCLLGDLVSGESIFVGQQLQIDRIVSDQVFLAAHRFASMIRSMSAQYPEVEVYCVQGNHGRIGRKGELHWRSNFDYITTRVIQVLLRDIANVRFVISEGPSLIVRWGEWNFLLHHGDSVPGGGASKGNFSSLENKVLRMSSMTDTVIHYAINGHFHAGASVNRSGGAKIISNGSWPGGSSFSIEVVGSAHTPMQKYLLFDPGKGVHSETDILLSDRVKLEPDENGVLTSYRAEG